jgi:outer membrane protein OmpA-like peptidoglycan-associated protein
VAVAATGLAVTDASAVKLVNTRVSDLGDYNTIEEAALFFNIGNSTLSDSDKQALNKLASDAMSMDNYMIEIAGYASSTGIKVENQKLSDARAKAVAQYLRDSKKCPNASYSCAGWLWRLPSRCSEQRPRRARHQSSR